MNMATHLLDDRARLFSLHNAAWGLLLTACLVRQPHFIESQLQLR